MLTHYLRLTLRNLWRYRGYSLINILGLAMGLASCLVILLYIWDEFSYDRFHTQSDRIYRINRQYEAVSPSITVGYPVLPYLRDQVPEVLGGTRILDYWFDPVLSTEKEGFNEQNALFVDRNFLKVFDFPLAQGSPAEAFSSPRSILLSPAAAKKYFGDKNPIGQTLTYNAQYPFTITGVFETLPRNSHFAFDVLIYAEDLSTVIELPNLHENWGLQAFVTYLLLPQGVDTRQLGMEITQLVNTASELEGKHTLQPLTDVHLYSDMGGELGVNSDIRFIWLLGGIALIILLLAAINYTNLTTSIFARRLREVGIRKTVGAMRSQLITQFLGESVVLAGIAFLIAVLLVELILPGVRQVTGRGIYLDPATRLVLLGSVGGLALMTGMLAGLYPSYYVARQRSVELLRALKAQPGRTSLWKWLVVGQFTLAIMLIVNTLMVFRQVEFMKSKQLGFNEELLISIPVRDQALVNKPDYVKSVLDQVPGVTAVSSSATIPGQPAPGTTFDPREASGMEPFKALIYFVDEAYLPTMDLKLIDGRNFDRRGEEGNSIILNESAVQAFGFKDPASVLDQQIPFWGKDRRVIGVVRDFHYESVRKQIEPLILTPEFGDCRGLVVRLEGNKLSQNLTGLQAGWEQLSADQPFTYYFLDQDLKRFYKTEQQFTKVMSGAAFLAIFIACLGLLGLAAFTAERRTKEMGIRKVLGASVSSILLLFNREFLGLVMLAVGIATPLAWWILQKWLAAFAYPAEIQVWVFVTAGAIVLGLALATVSFQSWRTARANPVEALRTE